MPFLQTIDRLLSRVTQNSGLALLVVLALTTLIYANIFTNDFVMDDYDFIVTRPLVQDLNNLPQFFGPESQPERQGGVYSPLKTVFLAVIFHFWEMNPFGYHLVSILVHLLTTVLIYQISFFLVRHYLVAFLAALFFGLHPVHAEAITFITASVDMIGILFLFTAFWLYLKAVEHFPQFKKGFYAVSLLYAVLAVFTYELALSLPLLIAFYEFCFNREKLKKRQLGPRLAPYFLIAVGYVLAKWLVLGSVTRGGYVYDSPYLTFLIMLKAFAKYILISLWPVTLSTNHIISPGIFSFEESDFVREAVLLQSIWDIQTLVSLLVLGAVFFVAIKYFNKNRLIPFCVGWFFISLLPVSNIVPSSIFFGERYLYPASFGFSLLLAYGLYHLYYWSGEARFRYFGRWLCIALLLGLSIFYSVRTVLRNQDWQHQILFYQKEAKSNPQSALMQTNLGVVYIEYGLFTEAVESFQAARRINPYDPHIYFSLAEAYTESGKHFDAIQALEKAATLDPDFAEAYYNIAVAKGLLGLMDESQEYLHKALKVYREQGRDDEAGDVKQAYEDYFQTQKVGSPAPAPPG